jgi:hypothetical protein
MLMRGKRVVVQPGRTGNDTDFGGGGVAEKESSFLCCEKKQVFENGGKLAMTLCRRPSDKATQ